MSYLLFIMMIKDNTNNIFIKLFVKCSPKSLRESLKLPLLPHAVSQQSLRLKPEKSLTQEVTQPSKLMLSLMMGKFSELQFHQVHQLVFMRHLNLEIRMRKDT